jgi:hypothetical protein
MKLPEGVVNRNKNDYFGSPAYQGNRFLLLLGENDPDDLWKQYSDFNDAAYISPSYGFNFDSSMVMNELTAINNVHSEYMPSLFVGDVDPAVKLPEALEKFISSNDDVDGFFFTTHILLEETIKFFCTKGIDIGRYKMASMRTNPFLEFMVPYLRVAHFPENEMGKKAVEILLNHIESRQKGEPWRNQEVTLNCSFQ